MKATSFVLALAAAVISPAVAAPLEKRTGGTCSTSSTAIQAPVVVGSGGTPFCESNIGTTNQPITNLTFWDEPDFVVGIQATYADGTTSPVYGRQTNRNPATIGVDYAQGQAFHSTQLFPGPAGNFTRHVRMVTSTGSIVNAGEGQPVANDLDFQAQPVGNGTLLGFQGSTGDERGDLRSLGFLFAA